jgi:hypothetical protein
MAEEEQRLVSGGVIGATDWALLATATGGNALIGAAAGSSVGTADGRDIRQDRQGTRADERDLRMNLGDFRTDRPESISMTSGLTDETSQPTCGTSALSVRSDLNGLSGPIGSF